MTTKKKTSGRKDGSRPFWRALFGILLAALTAAGIFLAAENENWYGFGIGGLLWALIPLACAVRLAVRTSRLSIIKTTVICLTGVLVIGAWTCISTQLLTGEPSAKWGGTLGLKAGGWLLEKAGGTAEDMKKTDERFVEAARFVVETQKASTSSLQTNLGLGFNRASRVMQQLEAAGIVGHQDGAKQREILVKDFDELDSILKSFGYK